MCIKTFAMNNDVCSSQLERGSLTPSVSLSALDDVSLVKASQQRNQEAFALLVCKYQRPLFTFAWYILQNHHVGATSPMMKKRRRCFNPEIDASECCEPVPRLIGVCAGTTSCCACESHSREQHPIHASSPPEMLDEPVARFFFHSLRNWEVFRVYVKAPARFFCIFLIKKLPGL